MADDGVRSNTIPSIASVDSLIGNAVVDGSTKTGRIDVDDLAKQLATTGPLSSLLAAGAFVPYTSKSSMLADLVPPSKTIAWVVGDDENDGIYRKSGGTGTGTWVWFSKLPYAPTDHSVSHNDVASMSASGRQARPGDPGAFFGTSSFGDPNAINPVPDADKKSWLARGYCARLEADGYIGRRVPVRIEIGREYRARFAFWRATDTSDPSGDAVRLAIRWLDGDFNSLGSSIFEDIQDLTVNDGRTEKAYDFPSTKYPRPTGAAYVRIYVRTYGQDGATDVELMDIQDMSDIRDAIPDIAIQADTSAASGRHSRPGDPGNYFGLSSVGLPEEIDPVTDKPEFNTRGATGRIKAAGRIARRVPIRIEPDRTYRARFVYWRSEDTSNPSGDAVLFGGHWFDGHMVELGGMVFDTVTNLRVSNGRQQRSYDFPDDSLPRPSGAVYFRPYLRAYGADGATAVELIDILDVSELGDGGGGEPPEEGSGGTDLTGILSHLATLDQQVEDIIGDESANPVMRQTTAAGTPILNTGAADTGVAAMGAPLFGRRERPMIGNFPRVLGGAIVKQDVLNNGAEGYNSMADAGTENESWIGWTSLRWTLPAVGDTGQPKVLIPFNVLDIPIDIRDGMIVVHLRTVQNVANIPAYSGNPNGVGNLDRFILDVYSEGHPDASDTDDWGLGPNCHRSPQTYPAYLMGQVVDPAGQGWWQKYMIPVNQLAPIGAGADLTHARFATLALRAAGGAAVKIDTALIHYVPNALDRAKVIFRVDDGKKGHYTDMAREFARHGWPMAHFPGAIGTVIRDDDAFFESTYMLKRQHDTHGHQIASQAWDSEQLTRIQGMTDTQRIAWMGKARAMAASLGTTGDESGSYYSYVGPQIALAREMFRTHFSDVQMFMGGDQAPYDPLVYGEMYPWGDAMQVRALNIEYYAEGSDDAIFERGKAHIDQAIKNKGVAIIAMHTYFGLEEFYSRIFQYLEERRDIVDVVTVQDLRSYPRHDLMNRSVSSLVKNPVYPVPQRLPLNSRVVMLGDNIMADALVTPGASYGGYQSWGAVHYALAELGGKLYLPPGGNVSDYLWTAEDVADDTRLDSVIAYRPRIVLLSCGGRSVYENLAETQDHIKHVHDRLHAAGIIVAQMTIIPNAGIDVNGERQRRLLNQYIKSRRSPLLIPVDVETLLDWAGGEGLRVGGVLNGIGAVAVGKAFAAAIEPVLEQGDILDRMAFDYTTNPTMSGGSTVATSWSLDTSNAGGATVAATKISEPGGNGGQQVAISGNYTGNNKSAMLQSSVTAGLPAVGDVVEAFVDIDIPSTMTRILSVSVTANIINDDFSQRRYSESMLASDGAMVMPDGIKGKRRTFRSPAFIVPAVSGRTIYSVNTNVTIHFADASGSQSIAGVFKIWRAGVRKVPAGA